MLPHRAVALPLLAAALPLLLAPSEAAGHRLGESYVFLSFLADRVEGRFEVLLDDLARALPLDLDGDGEVSDEELAASRERVTGYLGSRFAIRSDGTPVELAFRRTEILDAELGRFAQVWFGTEGAPAGALEVEYRVLLEEIPGHRGLLLLEYVQATDTLYDEETVALVFRPSRTRQPLDPAARSAFPAFLDFVREGVHHIWIGIDHILFLVALILPSVLTRRRGGWDPVPAFRPALLHVVKVVTLFTLAHSVTLSLAALGIVEIGSRLVESVIAASVVVAALNSGFLGRRIGPVIFLFGLFHGFGFASVLGHLTFDRRVLLPALVGFNVGVELGQVAILLAVFPVLWFVRRRTLYTRFLVPVGSGAIAAVALAWLVERALDVPLAELLRR